MTKSNKIAVQDRQRQRKATPKQLSSADLTNFSHGEERSIAMRRGFYSRRWRSFS